MTARTRRGTAMDSGTGRVPPPPGTTPSLTASPAGPGRAGGGQQASPLLRRRSPEAGGEREVALAEAMASVCRGTRWWTGPLRRGPLRLRRPLVGFVADGVEPPQVETAQQAEEDSKQKVRIAQGTGIHLHWPGAADALLTTHPAAATRATGSCASGRAGRGSGRGRTRGGRRRPEGEASISSRDRVAFARLLTHQVRRRPTKSPPPGASSGASHRHPPGRARARGRNQDLAPGEEAGESLRLSGGRPPPRPARRHL